MTIAASQIFKRVVTETQDDTSIRWTLDELIMYFNDGQRDILTHRPDALDERVTMALVPGATQALNTTTHTRLIDVVHNAVGSKSAIRQCEREILDAQLRNWRNQTGRLEVKHFIFNPKEAAVFEVYPPAITGSTVVLVASKKPTDITLPANANTWDEATGAMSLPEEYANALRDYIIYRMYLKNAKYTADDGRAMARYQTYANILGVDLTTTIGIGPKPGGAGNPNMAPTQ